MFSSFCSSLFYSLYKKKRKKKSCSVSLPLPLKNLNSAELCLFLQPWKIESDETTSMFGLFLLFLFSAFYLKELSGWDMFCFSASAA